jgi:hypothetical protein
LEDELAFEDASHRAYEAWRSRGIAADGSRRMTPGMVGPREMAPAPSGWSRRPIVTRAWSAPREPLLQGYNAQMVVDNRQIVVAAEVTTESLDFGPSRWTSGTANRAASSRCDTPSAANART